MKSFYTTYFYSLYYIYIKNPGKTQFKYIIKKNYKKIVSAFLTISIVITFLGNIKQNKLNIYFIDVGQGDSCLIITPENTKILIDGGGTENYNVRRKDFTPIFIK